MLHFWQIANFFWWVSHCELRIVEKYIIIFFTFVWRSRFILRTILYAYMTKIIQSSVFSVFCINFHNYQLILFLNKLSITLSLIIIIDVIKTWIKNKCTNIKMYSSEIVRNYKKLRSYYKKKNIKKLEEFFLIIKSYTILLYS